MGRFQRACKPKLVVFSGLSKGLCLVLLLVLFQCSAISPSTYEQMPVYTTLQETWPHQKSDLRPDPTAIFGRLPNGVRYILKENQTPSDRVSMHLFIQAGSLLESEQEQGAAHFLEHMLFNGSTHFPPGEMVKFFQRIGMQFGPDANAHTGFNETVYDVVLPKGDRDSLAEAMVVLKDYAQGALLSPEEVAREKKVILAEMRSRDSSRFRTIKATLNFEMPDLRIGRRFPIGEKAVVEKINAQILRGFYDAWYRPERMVLIMVGAFNVSVARQLINQQFGDIRPRATARDIPLMGRMEHKKNQYFYHQEAEAGATTVAIESVVQTPQPPDSSRWQRAVLLRNLAVNMMQKRLNALLQQPDTVLASANMGADYYLNQIKYAEIRADCKPLNWRKTLGVLDLSLRKALQYGFTTLELRCAIGDFQAQLKREAQERDTRDSNAIAREMMDSLSNWEVFQAPDQRLGRLAPILEVVTLDQVNQAFADIWEAPHRLVLVTGNVDLSSEIDTPRKQIETAFLASRQQTISPPVNKELAVFPYLPAPTGSGMIVQRQKDAELGLEKVDFANGFSLLLKPTRFKANQVLVALSFGQGKFSEPEAQPGLAQWTEAVINESGFGAIDRIALEEALAGRWANIELQVQEGMFSLQGEAVTSELPLLLQLLYTAIKDPGYRQEAFRLAFRQFEHQGQRLPHSVDGMMRLRGQSFFAGGDSRFGTPEWGRLQQCTLAQIKQWYGGQLHQFPMEMAVVGDFQPDTLVKMVAQYFGTLPKRTATLSPPNRLGPSFPSGQTLRLTAQTDISKALVVVAYPTDDFWDIGRTRRLAMVAELFSERLRQHIREALGAAYSPFAFNHSYRSFKNYGLLQIHVQVDPKLVDSIVEEVRQIADQLVQIPADADEFRRILDPVLTHIKDLRQANTYWLNSVLKGAARHPEQLEWARTFEKDYAAITSQQISNLSAKYLDNRQAAVVVITPTGKTGRK